MSRSTVVTVTEVYLYFLLMKITNILAKVLAGVSSDRPGTSNEAKDHVHSHPFQFITLYHPTIRHYTTQVINIIVK
jgi:hypothetical protein